MSNRLNQEYRFKIICFYSIIILMLFGLVIVSLVFAYWILSFGHDNSRLWLFAFFPILYALFAIFIFISYRPHKSRGLSIDKESAPRLFGLIEDAAHKVGYKDIIANVVLTPGMSISVNYNPNLINFLFDSRAKLYIGVLLCRILSKEELSATIAHELAHFSQSQTKYKAYLARISNIALSLGQKGKLGAHGDFYPIWFSLYTWPASLFSKSFSYLFESIFKISSTNYKEITADMELEADKISAQALGADKMLSALCKSYGTSRRMRLYKALVLPCLSSYGYRCDGFWNTFEASSSLFKSLDGLHICHNKRLLDLNRVKFDLSERVFALRYDALKQLSAGAKEQIEDEPIIDIIPRVIQKRMDNYLCRKYGQDTGVPVDEVKLGEILENLRLVLFANVCSMSEAFVIVNNLFEEIAATGAEFKQIVLPEYVRPACDVVPQPIVPLVSEFVYSSSIGMCPVCGCEIREDTTICPHCHEIISE